MEACLPLQNPSPDFETFAKVLKEETQPERVYLVELAIDNEITQYIAENLMGKKWVGISDETLKESYTIIVDVWHRMGYDFYPAWPQWRNFPDFKPLRESESTDASGIRRKWAEEADGLIKTWEDFEKIDWDGMKHDLHILDVLEEIIPEGMKLTITYPMYHLAADNFFGVGNLFILSYDRPDLVEAVFQKCGQLVYDMYKEAVQHPAVGAIFHGDDLGHKTALTFNPDFYRKHLFGWYKKYASLAHENGKMFLFHCCGNVLDIMEEFIEGIKIDAFHSFQDVIIPVSDFKKRYGGRIATLGGVDVDKLCRQKESELREYVRGILDECMPGGRYAIGSGNSVTNYVPVENYLTMVDEAMKWYSK